MTLILATASQHRKEIFGKLGIDFIAEASNIDETFEGRPDNPKELVQILARMKAEAVAKNHSDGFIIGFDSVAYFNNHILEKPKSREEAFQRLRNLSGRTYEFYTGVYVKNISTEKSLSRVVTTTVQLRHITDNEISMYLDQDSGFNTHAHGYNPYQFYSMSFPLRIEGSYTNLIAGLPVETILDMLVKLGYKPTWRK